MEEDDLLTGGRAINAYINRFMAQPLSAGRFYRACASGELPTIRFNGRLLASKAAIRQSLANRLGLPVGEPGQLTGGK